MVLIFAYQYFCLLLAFFSPATSVGKNTVGKSKVTQFSASTSSISKEIHPSSLESDCLHYELLRKGGLILLCDYLCENIGNVEYTTWVIVNYTQSLINSINESPVQDFVMSVHRTASSSGLLLQAVITRVSSVSDLYNISFLKDVLTVIENVHR